MKVDKILITSNRIRAEEERTRCLNMPNGPNFKSWIGTREFPLDWMKIQFGPTLKELDGLTYPSGSRFDDADCSLCNGQTCDEKVINLKFNNGEYDLELFICGSCLEELKERLKNEK